MIQQALFQATPTVKASAVPLSAMAGLTPAQRKRAEKGLHPLGKKLIPSGSKTCGDCELFEAKRRTTANYRQMNAPESWGYCKRTRTPVNVKAVMVACEEWIPVGVTRQDIKEMQEAVLDVAPENEVFGMTPEVWL